MEEELLQCIQQNYLPKRDTHFSRGPMDVLDHAAQQCGYGGKIMIDATVKFDEEGATTTAKPRSKKASILP